MMTGFAEMFSSPASASRAGGILLAGYFLGCFTAGYYLVRWRVGRDIREMGSGNIGARNVGRILGTAGFVATTLSDFGKGALAVWLARVLTHNASFAGLAMLAVVIGHIWPVQLGFRGGKGVATSLGTLAVCDIYLGLSFVALFAVIYLALRRTTLSGLIAFAFLPLAAMFLVREPAETITLSILAGIILFAHRKNLMAEFTTNRPLTDNLEPPNK